MILKDFVSFVTGAAQGIGREVALELARNGSNIVVTDMNLERAEETSKEISSMGVKSMSLRLDVSNPAGVEEAFQRAVKEMGRIDVLVNNAGIVKDALLIRMKEEDWDRVIDVNLKGTFLCTKEAVRIMAKQRFGRIISISSVVAFMGNPGQANYGASKAGIVGITKTVAKEYAGRGITANAIAPGFIQTAMTDALPENVKEEMMKAIPMARFGTAGDVAKAVLFFASKESGYITGQVLHINGGMYM